MPTETEKKYVLDIRCEPTIINLSKKQFIINQGYLIISRGISLRVRKLKYDMEKYYLTFKTNASGRVIEVEKKIDERDFNDLWNQCLNKLEKVRNVIYDVNNNMWEVDFFKDHEMNSYFALAEFEMPEGDMKPDFIPPFIENNLLYDVALTDSRFSSKLLADVKYALNLYKNIKEKKL